MNMNRFALPLALLLALTSLAFAGTFRTIERVADGRILRETTNDASVELRSSSEELATSAGSSVSTTSLIPAGARLLHVTGRVITTVTGATSFDVGDGGTGQNILRYGDDIAVGLGTTFGDTTATMDPESFSTSTQDVTLTANGPNFTGGPVRITAFYRTSSPPGS